MRTVLCVLTILAFMCGTAASTATAADTVRVPLNDDITDAAVTSGRFLLGVRSVTRPRLLELQATSTLETTVPTTTTGRVLPRPDGGVWVRVTDRRAWLELPDGTTRTVNIDAVAGRTAATVDAAGRLVIIDPVSGRIDRYDAVNPPVTQSFPAPQSFSEYGRSCAAAEAAALPDGGVVYTDWACERAAKITLDGQLIAANLPDNASPYGVAVTSDGAVWMNASMDAASRSAVLRWTPDGNVAQVTLPGQMQLQGDGNGDSYDIAAAADGSVWTTGGCSVAQVKPDMTLAPVHVGFMVQYVAVHPDGRLWVANLRRAERGTPQTLHRPGATCDRLSPTFRRLRDRRMRIRTLQRGITVKAKGTARVDLTVEVRAGARTLHRSSTQHSGFASPRTWQTFRRRLPAPVMRTIARRVRSGRAVTVLVDGLVQDSDGNSRSLGAKLQITR